MSEKRRKKTYNFHKQWEEEFFTTVKDKNVCLICGTTVATAKRHNTERYFSTCQKTFNASYPPGRSMRVEKACKLTAALGKQRSFFTRPVKKSQATTETLFRAAHILTKNKKPFLDGDVLKVAMMVIANTLFKDEKNRPKVISVLSDVQLGASTIARRVSAV